MQEKSVKISFLGDISFNNGYNILYSTNKHPFKKISEYLKKSDFVVGNLECLARSNHENQQKKPRLNTNIDTLNFLNELNLNYVTLAHNHVYDNMIEGYKSTISYIDLNNIIYNGVGESNTKSQEPIIININGINFCFLNYVTADTNPSLPSNAKIILNYFEVSRAINDIKNHRPKVDYVILLLHWGGNVEGGLYPSINQAEQGRKLIDAGADLIVGHHSHTVQPYEIYNNKYIFYSIGNFCFDDIISDGKIKKLSPRRKKGIVVNVHFKSVGYDIELLPIKNKNLFINPSNKLLFQFSIFLRNFFWLILKKNRLFYQLYLLKLKNINPIIYFLFIDKGSIKNKIHRIIKKLE